MKAWETNYTNCYGDYKFWKICLIWLQVTHRHIVDLSQEELIDCFEKYASQFLIV